MSWDGDERRHNILTDDDVKRLSKAMDGTPKIYGFKITDIVMVGSILAAVFAFYIRTNDTVDHLVKLTDYLVVFQKNSDLYHSTVTGSLFEQGRPIDVNLRNKTKEE